MSDKSPSQQVSAVPFSPTACRGHGCFQVLAVLVWSEGMVKVSQLGKQNPQLLFSLMCAGDVDQYVKLKRVLSVSACKRKGHKDKLWYLCFCF